MRLVDADKYKEELLSGYMAATAENDERAVAAYEDALGCLDSAPTIEAEPVVHAHWEWVADLERPGIRTLSCSHCHGKRWAHEEHKYCPHCGAKMDEDTEE